MWFLIAIFSSILFGVSGFLMKVSQMQRGSLFHLLFGLFASGTVLFFIHSMLKNNIHWWDWRLWLGGLVVGIGAAWGNLLFMKVLEYGPASLSSPLMNMNIVLVILLSVLFFQETLTSMEVIGIVFLLVAVVLISVRREPLTIKEKRWFFLIILAIFLYTFRNGGLKVTEATNLDNTAVLFIAYLLSSFWYLGLISSKSSEFGIMTKPSVIGLRWGILCGFFSYGGLQLYSVALEYGKASIVAPIFATNSLVIAIGSVLVYKERLKPIQLLALIFLFLGLFIIKM